MNLRRKNDRLEPDGNKPERFGGALPAIKEDELITLAQMSDVVNDIGAFTNIDPDNAVKLTTSKGVFYLPIFIYTK